MTIVEDPRFRFARTRKWDTWNAAREDVFLQMLAAHRGRRMNFLEIGTFEGASALWLLENVLTHAESRLTCIDSNRLRTKRRLLRNLERSGHAGKVQVEWIDSRDLRKHVPDDAFDFVYVDACHEAPAVLQDVINAYLVCKRKGLVGCDDYRYPRLEKGSRPTEAIDAFLSIYHDRVEVVHNGYQLWFRKLR